MELNLKKFDRYINFYTYYTHTTLHFRATFLFDPLFSYGTLEIVRSLIQSNSQILKEFPYFSMGFISNLCESSEIFFT